MKNQSASDRDGAPAPKLHAVLRRLLRARWQRYCHELKACQRQFSEDSVHESRVAARRLLATVELLASLHTTRALAPGRRVLKRHLHLLAPLRDAQVLLGQVSALPAAWPDARAFRKHLHQRARHAARRAQKGIARIKTKPLAKLVRRFAAALRRKARDTARRGDYRILLAAAARAHARAQHARRRVDAARPRTIHRTRVAFKKFRYMIELLAPLLPAARRRQRPALRRYQGLMGDIQDATVLLTTVTEFAGQAESCPQITRAVLDEIELQRGRLILRYLQHADRLDDFWPGA
jgi:CHAD domain-containing protein